jgi:hypothetical protein
VAPGGGGGGAGGTNNTGGTGAAGDVVITWTNIGSVQNVNVA